jgi:hypothetical protein
LSVLLPHLPGKWSSRAWQPGVGGHEKPPTCGQSGARWLSRELPADGRETCPTWLVVCQPTRPAKYRGENAVKFAKADLAPTEANLLPDYASFAELEAAILAHQNALTAVLGQPC